MFSLTEDQRTSRWDHRELCFGDNKYCNGNFTGDYAQHILSFGEDEAGKLKLNTFSVIVITLITIQS